MPALVQIQADRLATFRDRTLVYVNPHCQEFTTNRYDLIAENYQPGNSRHISELLLEGLRNGRLRQNGSASVKVAYHDPCMLGRGLGITEPPRELLVSLDGVELVEMDHNRQNSFCCGAKAPGEYFPDFRQATARERIDEFAATGADILITACHYCKSRFQGVLGTNNARVQDLCEFVDARTVYTEQGELTDE